MILAKAQTRLKSLSGLFRVTTNEILLGLTKTVFNLSCDGFYCLKTVDFQMNYMLLSSEGRTFVNHCIAFWCFCVLFHLLCLAVTCYTQIVICVFQFLFVFQCLYCDEEGYSKWEAFSHFLCSACLLQFTANAIILKRL